MSKEKKPTKPSLNKNTLKTAKRLLGYVTKTYKVQFIIVLICILVSSIATISVSLSLKFLLDDYIIPLIGQKSPDYTELYQALGILACIFLSGVIASFIYTRLMVVIGQGVLKRVRDEMFEHMQKLPIRYFDRNTNGSIMSLYTNDTDTLRQMINQSIPQVLMSALTIVVTFIAMLVLSPILTVLAVVMIRVMTAVARMVGGNSGKYFVRQQLDLASITGFVEERMTGQRVVKVFNHERISEEEFDQLNESLFVSSSKAHTFASIMGPVIGNMGNLQFVLTAVLGGALSVLGIGNITLGVMASYLQFTKSFTQPFMQIAQQFNSIIMALAGAERIFNMMDEEPEVDEGYVTLVNAKKDAQGNLTECKERTGLWAWKHPHQADGTVTYTELKGDVRFYDMTFGYTEDHMVLHDLTLYAKPGQKLAFDPSRNQMMKQGRILKGKEYLTVFSGDTGEALHTIDYIPARGNVADWGDAKGNRSDRFLACVAYLDGVHPSVVMCRGYYTRTVLAAFDWNGKELKNRWVFDSNHPGCEQYAGQGNHNLRVGDVDGDGCDEIIYGSCAIDHNGKGLYSTRMGHGDAIHLTHFDPSRKGLQVWDCHENKRDGSTYRDAATGEVLLQLKSNTDVGRCMAADIDPTHPGVEMWSGDSQGIRNVKGEIIAPKMRNMPTNMAVWWDGDLLRELLDRNMIIKYDWENKKFVPLVKFTGTLFNNGTKSNPCLQGDIIGDWREEVLVRSENNAALRLYVSTIPTEYRFHTFLEEPIYRISIATQNVGYNQPTQPGFYFGPDLIKMKGTFRGYQFK